MQCFAGLMECGRVNGNGYNKMLAAGCIYFIMVSDMFRISRMSLLDGS